MKKGRKEYNNTVLTKIIKTYPEAANKTKKQRIIEVIKEGEKTSPMEGIVYLPESLYNVYKPTSWTQSTGPLEDCTEEYIRQIARMVGYSSYHSLIGGIALRKKEV